MTDEQIIELANEIGNGRTTDGSWLFKTPRLLEFAHALLATPAPTAPSDVAALEAATQHMAQVDMNKWAGTSRQVLNFAKAIQPAPTAPSDKDKRIAELEAALRSVLNQPESTEAYDAMMQRVTDALGGVEAPVAKGTDSVFASKLASAAETILNDYPEEAALLRMTAREYAAAPAQETWKELPSRAGAPPLDDDLRFILGRPCFTLIGMANVLRQMGYEIASRAEDEQAVSIHWMLDLYMKHGKAWREEASQILDLAKEAAKGGLVSLSRNPSHHTRTKTKDPHHE